MRSYAGTSARGSISHIAQEKKFTFDPGIYELKKHVQRPKPLIKDSMSISMLEQSGQHRPSP